MTIQQNDINLHDTGSTVTCTLPDIRMPGSLTNGEADNTLLFDFSGGPFAEPDGHGSSLFKLINAMMSDPTRRATVVTVLQDCAYNLAKTFAGLQDQ